MGKIAAAFVLFVCLSPSVVAQEPEPDPGADLTISKTGPDTASAGSDVTYTVIVTNEGPEDAVNAVVRDQLPAGMTFVSVTQTTGPSFACAGGPDMFGNVDCTIALFAVGASAQFEFVFNIPPETPPGTLFSDLATISSTTFDPNEENNQAPLTTSTPPPPTGDLGVIKTGSQAAGPDTDVEYTITLTNGGPQDAENVSLTDTLPGTMTFVSLAFPPALNCTTPAIGAGGTITCTATTLPVGTTILTLTGHIPADTSSGTTFQNTASVTSDNDPNGENNAATITTTVSSVDISITKSGPASADAGTDVSFTIIVTNESAEGASATMSDSVPSGTTFVSLQQDTGPTASCSSLLPGATFGSVDCTAILGPGQSMQFTFAVNAGAATIVDNIATVTTDSFDPNQSNNSDNAITSINQIADVSVVKNGPATITAGTNATYTITVANAGPSNASGVALSDTLPPEMTFVAAMQTGGPVFTCTPPGTINCMITLLPVDTTATFTLTAHLDSTTAPGTSLTNTATVTSQTFDSDTADQTSSTTATTIASDLSVTKNGPATIAAGTNATYTITVANSGLADAANVTLADTLPAQMTFVSAMQTGGPAFTCTPGTLSCNIAVLPAGATATFSLTAHLDPATPDGTAVTNTAQVTTSTADGDTADHTSSTTATSTVSAGLSVSKSGAATVIANTNITYTITVTNSGPSTPPVTLTDVLSTDTTFVSLDQSGPAFSCTTPSVGASGTITCTATSMAVATTTFTLVLHVSPTATTPLTNTATVNGTTSSTATTTVLPPSADVAITKNADRQMFTPGESVTFTIVVTNVGSFDALDVTVNDALPAGLTLTSASSTQGTCTMTNPVVCTVGTLVPSASATITLVATATGTSALSNTATVSSSNDINPANDTATAVIGPLNPIPTLSSVGLAAMAIALALLALRR